MGPAHGVATGTPLTATNAVVIDGERTDVNMRAFG
jgi:hypothetical protein